jgi:glutamate N-acetyltransferase/amino-acid N-acetyltransferase
MTTDTFPKVATPARKIGKAKVVINGIAKGAGMIAPDMATMLSFVFTDAPIARPCCRRCSPRASRARSMR